MFAAISTVLDSNTFDLCLQETMIGADVPNSILDATSYIVFRPDRRVSGSGGINLLGTSSQPKS